MAKSAPGYLLPEGECYTDNLACTLVFYPDKPEYRRALLGSITYLSTWLAWERDADKRGQDAARAWKNAVDETLECWTMTCLEDLIADVETIRILLENKKDCCDGNTTYYPDAPPTSDIVPYVGDPPEYYGETAISDWEEWSEHVCFNANKYVDYLKGTADELERAVLLSTIYIGVIAAALTLLAFTGIGLAIAYGVAAAVVAGIALSATIATFEDTSANFEAARETIVCAVMNGYQLPEAIETALSSGTDWDLFYQFVDYASAMAIIHEGGFGSEYLPTDTDDSCGCEVFQNYLFDFAIDSDGWDSGANLWTVWDAGEFVTVTNKNTGEWKFDNQWTWAALAVRFSFGLPITYDQVRFKFYNHPGTGVAVRHLFLFQIESVDGYLITDEIDTDDYSVGVWHEIIYNSPVTKTSQGDQALRLKMYRYSGVGDGQRVWFDNFGLYKR